MKKYILLVAGYEYSGGGTDFNIFADRRRKYILWKNPTWENDTDVVFVRFDVKNGKIEKNVYDGTSRNWVEESNTFDAINRRTHYTSESHFIQADNNVMSITDAYNYVINIGRTEPGTVLEFNVLGHGWMGGPVLVNSYQRDDFSNGGATPRLRDPWDKDGRSKDFNVQNMSDENWNLFKAAFKDNGFCWVWGCVFTRAYYNTLYKVMRTQEFRAKRFGTHVDSDTFRISVSSSFVRKYYHVDRTFFPTDNDERVFTRSLLQLKQFLKRGMLLTYAARLTLDTGIECRNAMLGTYSDFERKYPGHRPLHTVMEIPRNTATYGTNFTKTIDFYKTYLNVSEDPEERGYGVYTSTQLHQWIRDTRI